jgi:regulator of replication initiation timing
MTDDIVARLRNGYALDYDQNELFKFCNEAADEIERLRERRDDWRAAMTENHDLWREIERLRMALREIEWSNDSKWQSDRARAALEGEKTDDAAT